MAVISVRFSYRNMIKSEQTKISQRIMFLGFHSQEDICMSDNSGGKKKFSLKIAVIGAVGALILIVGAHFMLLMQDPMPHKAPVTNGSKVVAPAKANS